MTAKQFNPRVLMWALAPFILVGVGVHFLHGYQVGRHAEALRAQAREAEEEGHLARAATCLRRFLVFAPDDTPALLHYAQLLDRQADSPDARWYAVAAFRKVLLREPGRHDVRRRTIDLLMGLELVADARDQLEVLIQLRPGDAEVEELLGRCQETCGDREPAVASYTSAIAHAPGRLSAYLLLARLLEHGLGEPVRAEEVMDRLVHANAERFEAHFERAHYRAAHGALDDAAADMTRAVELAPTNENVLVAAADLALRRGHADEARRHLRHGRKLHPRNAGMHLRLAGLELRRGRTAAALVCLHEGLKALPDNPDLLDLLAEVQIDRDERIAAAETIARLRRSSAPLADYLRGRLLCQRGRWAEAVTALDGVTRLAGVGPGLAARAWVALGLCHEHLGDADRRLAAFEKAVALDPASAPARLGFGAALLDAGRVEEAVAQLRQAADLPDPPPNAWLLLGRALVLRAPGEAPEGKAADELRRALDRVAKASPRSVALALLRADVLAAGGQADEARQFLEQTLARQPGEPALWIALARLAARRGELTTAGHILDDALQEIGDRLDFRLARLELRDRRVGRDALPELRELAKGIGGFTPAEQVRLLCRLARAFYDTGNFGEGDRLCRDLAARPVTDLHTHLPVLDLALDAGDDATLARVVGDLRRLEGASGTWWRYGKAARRLRQARRGDRAALDEAAAQLAVVKRSRPAWSRAALLEAQVEDVRGDRAAAAEAYRRAFDLGEHQPAVAGRLLRLLIEHGRFVDADQVVRRLQQEAVLRPDLARLGAEVALKVHSYDRAQELARQVVAEDSPSVRDHVWLGEVLDRAGRRADAEAAFRQAVRLGDRRPDAWLALVAFLARTGQRDEARAALDDMQARLTPEDMPLALALGHEAIGRADLAEASYRQALSRRPEAPAVLRRAAAFHLRLNRPRQAAPLLRRLLTHAARLSPAEVAWARRHLALTLPASADGEREALALLQRNRQAGADAVADRRALALIEAVRPEKRRASVRAVEESRKLRPLAPYEQFRLVLIYEADGDSDRVAEQLIDLLALDGRNPEYLAHYIGNLLRRGKREEARPWVTRLAEIEPGSVRVKEFEDTLRQPAATP